MDVDSSGAEYAKWAAVIVGLVTAVPLTAVLANQAPMALLAVIVLGFLSWAGIRSGLLANEEADAKSTTEVDPLTTLQERYASGELSEAEFERRLDRILDSDAQAQEAADAAQLRERKRREREPETGRE